MADEDLTPVDDEDGSPSVPKVCMVDIDVPTVDLHGGSILRGDPRRDSDGDSRFRAVANCVDEEPAPSSHAHLGRAHHHFLSSAFDHLSELSHDDLPLPEQEEFTSGTRRGSLRH